jgi:hypothetical protein
MKKVTIDETEEAVIFKASFCKTMCKQYGECGNVTKALTKDGSESLVAPCHWGEESSIRNKKEV